MVWLKFCDWRSYATGKRKPKTFAKSLAIYDIFANQIKCQTLKIKAEVMTEKNGTCANRLLMFDSISVFYVPGRYVYAKGNRDTARDRDVD